MGDVAQAVEAVAELGHAPVPGLVILLLRRHIRLFNGRHTWFRLFVKLDISESTPV